MPNFIVFSALVPRVFGARVILDLHDTMPELFLAKFGITERHPLYRILVWEERLSACIAHTVVATHMLHKQIFMKHGIPESKIRVIMNLANPTFFHRGGTVRESARSGFRFIYHGTITRRLGLDIALKAFKQATDVYPHISFTIIGDGDALADLLTLSDSLELGDRVTFFRRFLPVEELTPHIQQADAGIVSNRSDPATDFMLPVKLLEYVYMRIPCIAARTPAMLHYFDESMIMMFAPGDVDDLARCMVRLSTDPSLRESLVSSAERFNREHNWESEQQNYLEILNELEGRRE
jgi:glycosyltransferase involved in cell wall biosynthesis